jgi:hypothetical protein
MNRGICTTKRTHLDRLKHPPDMHYRHRFPAAVVSHRFMIALPTVSRPRIRRPPDPPGDPPEVTAGNAVPRRGLGEYTVIGRASPTHSVYHQLTEGFANEGLQGSRDRDLSASQRGGRHRIWAAVNPNPLCCVPQLCTPDYSAEAPARRDHANVGRTGLRSQIRYRLNDRFGETVPVAGAAPMVKVFGCRQAYENLHHSGGRMASLATAGPDPKLTFQADIILTAHWGFCCRRPCHVRPCRHPGARPSNALPNPGIGISFPGPRRLDGREDSVPALKARKDAPINVTCAS